MLSYISNQALQLSSSTNSQPTTRGRTRWEVSCAHPAVSFQKSYLGISSRVERQKTEQRADGHGCRVKGRLNKISGAEGEELVPRIGSSSVVWKFWGFRTSDVNREQIICTECVRVVSAPHSNTTNLFNHLKSHHRPQYDECMKAKSKITTLNHLPFPTQKTITATLHGATVYPSTSQRHTEVTDAIAFHLAKDMCPINTVSNEGFRKMVNTLDKRYVIPSRNYFSKQV